MSAADSTTDTRLCLRQDLRFSNPFFSEEALAVFQFSFQLTDNISLRGFPGKNRFCARCLQLRRTWNRRRV